MAGSAQQKTEQATPRKLRQARDRGQVAQSRTLTGALQLLVAGGVLLWLASSVGASFREATRSVLELAATGPTLDVTLGAAGGLVATVLPGLAMVFVVVVAIGVLVSFLQVRGVVSLDPLTPKFERLEPVQGLRQRVFSMRSFIELVKSLAIIALVAFVLFLLVRDRVPMIVTLSRAPIERIGGETAALVTRLFMWTAGVYVAIAVADLAYQRWQFARDQRMTKEEVVREHKQEEGDPQHKAARKRLHEEILSYNMVQEARKADVIVTNPDHIACALKFHPDEGDRAPRLIARGKNWLAEEIKKAAREEGIPVTRDVSLARALYELEIDQEIPGELHEAARVVLRWVADIAHAYGEVPPWERESDETERPGS